MTAIRFGLWAALCATLLLLGCGADGARELSDKRPIFGNGAVDNSRVVARVNGEEITERMLDLRLDELSKSEQNRFSGEDGRRLLVRKMVDELLAVRAAEDAELDLAPDVARILAAQYRGAMNFAHDNVILEGIEPSVDQIRDYFERNRDLYTRLGIVHASHVACATEQAAREVYAAVTKGGTAFSTAARQSSVNKETAANGGDLGWFNPGGFIPGIKNSKEFTEMVWDLQDGVNEPVQFGDHWHVVEIHKREFERPMTLAEAYGRVESDVLPELQAQAKREWLQSAKQEATIEYFGEFRPGQGKTAKELLERAFYVKDPQQKIELLTMLIEDYPDDEYTDDAMFMAGNVFLDEWGDRRQASFFLLALVRKFPESELAADAQYLLDNIDNPRKVSPDSIEDLRR